MTSMKIIQLVVFNIVVGVVGVVGDFESPIEKFKMLYPIENDPQNPPTYHKPSLNPNFVE